MDVGCKVSENCLSFCNIHKAIAAVDDYQERETASFSVFKVEKNFGNSGRYCTAKVGCGLGPGPKAYKKEKAYT